MRIKKGDQVLIQRGKDKNKKGKVERTFPKTDQILVEGCNIKKIHKRPKKEGEKGQVVEVAFPFAVCRAMFVCPNCNKQARIGYVVNEKTKVRVCKKCKAEV